MNSLRSLGWLCAGGDRGGSTVPIPDERTSVGMFFSGALHRQIETCCNYFSVVPSFHSFSVVFCQIATGRTELQATAHNLKWVCCSLQKSSWQMQYFLLRSLRAVGRNEQILSHRISWVLGQVRNEAWVATGAQKGMQNYVWCVVRPLCKYLLYCSYWNTFTDIFWQSEHLFWKHFLGFEGCSYSIVCSIEGEKKWEVLFRFAFTCGSSSPLMKKSLGSGRR